MSNKPEVLYDAEHKIWSGKLKRGYFSPNLSVGEIIFHEMRRHTTLIAQVSVSENTVLTRGELLQNSMRVACYMRSLDIHQSDIVGIVARNTTHLSAVAYGCFFNGIPFHALHINYEEEVIRKLFALSNPRLIFCDGDEYEKIKAATSDLNTTIVTMRNHPGETVTIDEVLETPVDRRFEPYPLESGNKHTLAIICTSGTTGTPKALTISNHRGTWGSASLLTIKDVQFSNASIDYVTGLNVTIISGLYSTKRIITDKPFDPVQVLNIIEEHEVTWITQPPIHLARMVHCAEFETTDFDSIRYYIVGGCECFDTIQKRLRNRIQKGYFILSYGISELGFVSANWNTDDKPNSVGRVRKGFKLKVVDDQGNAQGPNQVGELYVYSDLFWAGYYRNIEETQKARDAGNWFITGDMGYVDDDGFLYIVDRKKDMLKYQVNEYSPSDIEKVISEMPGVAEVCVFGIFDQFNGDAAAAAVVKRSGYELTAQDVVDYVQQNIKAEFKHLRGGALIVDHLKLSANGKTNRRATKIYFIEQMASKK